jgi:hypothetical protein
MTNNTDLFPFAVFFVSFSNSKPCVAGKFGDSLGGSVESATCENCPFGFYQSATSSIECTACATGKYGDAAQQTSMLSCQDCDKGQYLDQQGQSTCKDCLAGQFGEVKGATNNTACKECPGKSINTLSFLRSAMRFFEKISR